MKKVKLIRTARERRAYKAGVQYGIVKAETTRFINIKSVCIGVTVCWVFGFVAGYLVGY